MTIFCRNVYMEKPKCFGFFHLNISAKDCHHSKKQESLIGLISERCSNNLFVGRVTLELGVASAVIAFNDGSSGIIEVFNKISIKPETFCKKYCGLKDEKRVIQMDRKSKTNDSVKQRSKKLRAHRKRFQDKCEENEGVPYEAKLF